MHRSSLFHDAQDNFSAYMASFSPLMCFVCLSQRHNRIYGYLYLSSIDQFADFGQLYTTGLQHLTMACPNSDTRFRGPFSGIIANVNRYKPATTLKHGKQAIIL